MSEVMIRRQMSVRGGSWFRHFVAVIVREFSGEQLRRFCHRNLRRGGEELCFTHHLNHQPVY